MLVTMKLSAAFKGDVLQPGESFDLPEKVAISFIAAELAVKSDKAAKATREVREALMQTKRKTEKKNDEPALEEQSFDARVAELRKEYTVPQLQAMLKEMTGKSSNAKELGLAQAIAKAEAEMGE